MLALIKRIAAVALVAATLAGSVASVNTKTQVEIAAVDKGICFDDFEREYY